ncbi:MAG: thioesterase [Desulfobacterales bacterium]|nr:thioesterase [Desulfobacterales bacterium]
MNINTHNKINNSLCGTPLIVKDGYSQVELILTENMKVDDYNLVHGGFIFGLADYAAMIAVNHPNVVLGSSEVKFLKPVIVDDILRADALVELNEGKKRIVNVSVYRNTEKVFEGKFICFALEKHVLNKN